MKAKPHTRNHKKQYHNKTINQSHWIYLQKTLIRHSPEAKDHEKDGHCCIPKQFSQEGVVCEHMKLFFNQIVHITAKKGISIKFYQTKFDFWKLSKFCHMQTPKNSNNCILWHFYSSLSQNPLKDYISFSP